VLNREFIDIVEAARVHYENLKADIENASNRIEHIRLTALAQEAHNLLTELRSFNSGLVYSHTASRVHEQIWEEVQDHGSTELDFPEFKSPFDPRNN
jgi:hypothetical protein